LRLDFSSAPTGEARQAGREDIESLSVVNESERPANTSRIMEEVCERANLKEALRQVKGNKGSAGVDRMTVNQLGDYLKESWPANPRAIAERDLRTETGEAGGNPKAGRRRGAKAWHPDALGIMHLIQFALGMLNGDDLSWRPIFASVDRQRRRL